MSEELYGVFFKASGEECLRAVEESEEEAEETAIYWDERTFQEVQDDYEGEGDEPEWEDYQGMHYVETIAPGLAKQAEWELSRGFVVRVG